tara:strand:- start:4431 stop:10277 length:5847 start_codon:yes stop_codon:yes gene_type:complete
MIPIKRNHFYTKEIISNAVGVYPQFKDLGGGGSETTIEFKGGLGGVRYLTSGKVSATPAYRSSELRGGFLQFFVTGMSMTGSTTLPQLSAYKLQNGISVSEGGFTLASGTTSIIPSGSTPVAGQIGDALWFSSSQLAEDNTYLEESFDGSSTSLGSAFSTSFGGAAAYSLDDAFVVPERGAEAIFTGGDAFFGGGGSNNVVHNLEKWFSVGGTDRSDTRVFVRPAKKGRKQGLWTAVNDHRGEKEKWQIYAPFWKWEAIRPILKFGSKEPVEGWTAGSDSDEDPEATSQNTVFESLYVSNLQTGYPGASFGTPDPSLSSKATLETGLGTESGQGLKLTNTWMTPHWEYNKANWMSSGDQAFFTHIPSQTIGATLGMIPYPLPNNIGGMIPDNENTYPNVSGAAYTAGKYRGDQRVVFPEINLKMRIDSMLPSPAIDLTDTGIAGTKLYTFNSPDHSDGGAAVTGACSEITIADDEADLWPHNKTMWRDVVITFSNISPAKFTTLDKFLAYAQNKAMGRKTDAYGDVQSFNKFELENDGESHLGPAVVGGIVFSAFYSNDKGATGSRQDGRGNTHLTGEDVVYAYNLPVAPIISGTAYNKYNPMLQIQGDATEDFTPQGAILHRPEIAALRGSGRKMPYVPIPINRFFNMKFVIDVMQPWTKETSWGFYAEPSDTLAYGDLDAPHQASGVPMRVYFDIEKEDNDSDTITDDEDTDTTLPMPWLNVGFSAEYNSAARYYMSDIDQYGDYQYERGNTGYFPHYMKIWVNNVGFAPASGSTPKFWGETNSWFDSTYWTSDDYSSKFSILGGASNPILSGPNPIETSITIDSLDLKNFSSDTTNMSTGAGISSRSFTGFSETVDSPAAVIHSTDDADDYTKGFNQQGVLWPLLPGFNVTLGYKDWDWNPIVEASPAGGTGKGAKAGYLLWNNFNTLDLGALDRAKPVVAWISTSGQDSYVGDYNRFPGMEMGAKNTVEYASDYAPTQSDRAKVFITTGSTSAPSTTFTSLDEPVYSENAYISMGYEGSGNWLSTDGLTQKGFLKFNLSSGNSAPDAAYSNTGSDSSALTNGNFIPRENVLTSTKILRHGWSPKRESIGWSKLDKDTIMVENIDIFHKELDDEYIIYKGGSSPRPDSNQLDPITYGPHIGTTLTVAAVSGTLKTNIITGSAGDFDDVEVGMAMKGAGFGNSLGAIVIAKPSSSQILVSQNSRSTAAGTTMTFYKAASNALGYKMKVKMVGKDITSSMVKLKVTNSDGTGDLGLSLADNQVTQLFPYWAGIGMNDGGRFWYISPKRYWLNMMFGNEFGTKRTYENICMIDQTPATGSLSTQTGSTFNESNYTYNVANMTSKGLAAVLEKPWILGVTDERTALIVNEDYGYGSYNEEKDTGGEVGKNVPVLNSLSYFPLSKMVETVQPGPEEEVTLVVGLTDEVSEKIVTVVGDDTTLDTSGSTYYRPQYVWEYYDEKPKIDKFTVSSQFDILSPDVDLYSLTKQPINNIMFKWTEDAEDIWYRHILIDSSGSINDKYHRSSFWLPLNETNVNDSSYYFNYYLDDVQDKDTTQRLYNYRDGATPQMTIDGINGYTPYFKNSASSGKGPPCYVLGDWTTDTGSYDELLYSMAHEMGGSGTSNAWVDKWSLSIHCNPRWSDALALTRSEGMTVCGVVQCASGAQSSPSIAVTTGSRSTPQGNKTYTTSTWNNTSTGGFDLLHVYMKNSRVYVGYNVQYKLTGDASNLRPYMTGSNKFEALLLSSSTSYKMDGTEPIAITIVWNKNRGIDAGSEETTTINSDDQFRLYVNGQLEDSQSTKYGIQTTDGDNVDGPDNGGGFGRSNYAKFVVGAIPGGSEMTFDGLAVSNIYAGVGEETSSGIFDYRMQRNGFQGTIEEIVLYPYEVYVPDKAGEYILNTRTLDDFSATGTTGTEKNYVGRLFAFDYTNVRGRSPEAVSSSNTVQWKVTGV